MCYFAITDFTCGDWRWGNLMERCPRQHKTGETCGAKLVDGESITKSPDMCNKCVAIKTKQRTQRLIEANIRRWTTGKMAGKMPASLEKARRQRQELQGIIESLESMRASVIFRQKSRARHQSRTFDGIVIKSEEQLEEILGNAGYGVYWQPIPTTGPASRMSIDIDRYQEAARFPPMIQQHWYTGPFMQCGAERVMGEYSSTTTMLKAH